MVINLRKGKGIIDDLEEPKFWKEGIDLSIVSNLNNYVEQEELRKNLSGRSELVNMQQKCDLLDQKLKEIEGVNDLESVDPRELCLVPDLVMSSKFKMPKFEKYDGTKCPENHLAMYCNKMAGHARNKDLLIHVFYDSLVRAVAQWYTKLKKDQICTWRDLARAFLEQYKYMLETASDRLTLQCMKKRPEENYKEYAVRWKNVASMVRPPLTSREENSMFVDILPSSYYDMLVVNAFVEFEDLMYYVGRIEDGIKRGKIVDIEATTFGKKGNVPNKHVEEPSRRKFEAMGESVENLFHSCTPCTQMPPVRCFSP